MDPDILAKLLKNEIIIIIITITTTTIIIITRIPLAFKDLYLILRKAQRMNKINKRIDKWCF